ncbi:hypothetical protein TeGR_g10594 [Tetraparma gracilis]|uniref:Uncharacterized protein n=1 Tax=Tetraparma gracilis TaxID=2962635 RepID=A0ABQ6N6I5_9STRA|nr:hypothetical protein TeGR_g10594 [Tetraparma gracilis]
MGNSPSSKPSDVPSAHFPLKLPGCASQTDKLFACLDAASSSHLSSVLSPSADSVPQLPSSCASSIAAYNDCTDRHIGKSGNVKFRRVQERVPEEYRWGGEKQ